MKSMKKEGAPKKRMSWAWGMFPRRIMGQVLPGDGKRGLLSGGKKKESASSGMGKEKETFNGGQGELIRLSQGEISGLKKTKRCAAVIEKGNQGK